MGLLIAGISLVGIFFLISWVTYVWGGSGWYRDALATAAWVMLVVFGGAGLLGLFFFGFLKIVGAV